MSEQTLSQWVLELQAIGQTGLTYCEDKFDRERYEQILRLAAKMSNAIHAERTIDDIFEIFALEKGYATPKLDTRAFILKDDRILLVKERADKKWTLPGGWTDVNHSPSESMLKEIQEETGHSAKIVRLLALWDKQKWDNPEEWPHIYKACFHCEITGGHFEENIEILELDYFALEKLPPLSTPRITAKQLETLMNIVQNNLPVQVD